MLARFTVPRLGPGKPRAKHAVVSIEGSKWTAITLSKNTRNMLHYLRNRRLAIILLLLYID
jgi:hypothetical protein